MDGDESLIGDESSLVYVAIVAVVFIGLVVYGVVWHLIDRRRPWDQPPKSPNQRWERVKVVAEHVWPFVLMIGTPVVFVVLWVTAS